MGLRILVTRPEPGALNTARRLAEHGHDPVVLPLSRTGPVPDPVLPVDTGYAAIALTSGNAVRHLTKQQLLPIAALPVFAVGPATAKDAGDSGLRVEWTGRGNAATLAGEMARRFRPGQKILYLTGRVRRPEFEQQLCATGVAVDAVETYFTESVSYTTKYVADLLSHAPIEVVLVYSAVAAEQLARLMSDRELSHLFESARFICLSSRIGTALPGLRGQQIITAVTPSEDAVLEMLNSGKFNRS